MTSEGLCDMPPGGCVGVDPGRSSGGIAYVADGQAWARKISDLTDRDLWEIFDLLGQRNPRHAVLEKVSAMPGQGVSSTFKFGASYGELKAWLVAAAIPFTTVTPRKWQREMSCLSKGDKNKTKARAQELYPGIRITHAIADALLMATYASNL